MSAWNTLVKLLGIKYPIVQAPMAGVSTPQLAAAVSNSAAPNDKKSDFAAHWAGTGLTSIRELKAADLVQTLVAEFHS